MIWVDRLGIAFLILWGLYAIVADPAVSGPFLAVFGTIFGLIWLVLRLGYYVLTGRVTPTGSNRSL